MIKNPAFVDEGKDLNKSYDYFYKKRGVCMTNKKKDDSSIFLMVTLIFLFIIIVLAIILLILRLYGGAK